MNPFAISIIVLFTTALLIIHTKFHWFLKSIFIVGLISSSLFVFLLVQNYQGTPIPTNYLPEKIIVHGQSISLDEQKICILYTLTTKEFPPEYYILDYNKDLHKALAEGKKKHKGEAFELKISDNGQESDSDSKGSGKKGKSKNNSKSFNLSLESLSYTIHDLPKIEMPPKEY